MEERETLTIKEAAVLTGKTTRMIYWYVEKRKLTYIRESGKPMMVYKDEVENLYKPIYVIPLEKGESIRIFEAYPTSMRYGVTNFGRIFNMKTSQELSQCTDAHDYKKVIIIKRNGQYVESVHRMVALTWCPNILKKNGVHHLDGDKTNNHAGNLLWADGDEHAVLDDMVRIIKERNWDGNSKDYRRYSEYAHLVDVIKMDNTIPRKGEKRLALGFLPVYKDKNKTEKAMKKGKATSFGENGNTPISKAKGTVAAANILLGSGLPSEYLGEMLKGLKIHNDE